MTTKITSRSLLQRLIGTAILSLTFTGISVQASLSSSQSKHVGDISLPKESVLDSFGKETLLAVGLDTSTLGKFRAKTTLTADDTAAFVEGQGISKTFGVNSGAQTRAAQELNEPNTGLELRQSFFERIQKELGELSGKKMNPDAQALLHAEAHTLMRASKKYGTLPKNLTIHVDRKTCNFCSGKTGLPLMMKLLKIDELTIYSPDRNFKLVRKGDVVDSVSLN